MKGQYATRFLGVALLVFAVAIATIPQFTSCQSQGKVLELANGKTTSMKCYWTGQAELATGIPLFAVGAMTVFSRRKESLRYLGIMGIVLGAFAIALPTKLIGVCSSEMMLCHNVMRPSLITLGSLVIVTGGAGLIMSLRKTPVDV